MLDRLGLHELAITNARSNRMPSRASRSMCGVLSLVPIGPAVVPAHVVGDDQDHIGPLRCFGGPAMRRSSTHRTKLPE